jgi:hypothetical protein
MRSASRSLITNNKNVLRTVINPIETASAQDLQFDRDLIRTLKKIELDYVKNMAERKYLQISQDMDKYLTLDYQVGLNLATAKNSNVKLLLEIARDGLTGALHSRTLNTDVTELTIKNTILEKRIEDILSGKNEVSAMDDTCGEFVITKTFKLAPLYSYYIMLYGLPAFGVGFDPSKLTLVADILRRYCIEPFS